MWYYYALMTQSPRVFLRNLFSLFPLRLVVAAFVLAFVVSLAGCSSPTSFLRAGPRRSVQATLEGGVFLFPRDMEGATFPLAGEWVVLAGEYRPPAAHPPDPADQTLLGVPPPRGRFYLPSGERYMSGPITYRAVLRGLPRKGLSGIKIPLIQGGLRAWTNGDLLFSAGFPDDTSGVSPIRMERSLVLPLLPDGNGEVDLVLAFDNAVHPYGGGALTAPVVGKMETLQRARGSRLFRDGLLKGALLLAGAFHLLLFPASRRDWRHPFFSLICVTAALFLGTLQGEMVLATLGVLKGLPLIHLQGLLLLGFPALYFIFLQRLFPRELSLREMAWPVAGLLVLLGLSLVTPLRWKLDLAVLAIPWVFWGAVVTARTLWRARTIPRGGALLVAGGVLVWALCGLSDGIHLLRGARPLVWLSPWGTLLFVLANSLALSRRVVDYRLSLALLQHEAHRDGLTNLWNRRGFDLKVIQEWQRHYRERTSLALVLVDIDHFKQYNDTLGHQAGDRALQEVSRLLCTEPHRRDDYLARYGGEEFVLLLPDTTCEGAYQVALRACERVRGARIPHPRGIDGVLTISLGVAAAIPGDGEDPESGVGRLLRQADQALYRAKKRGRNTVEAGGPLAVSREQGYSGSEAHEQ